MAQLIVVVIIVVIVVIIAIPKPREARLLTDDDNDGLGVARQHTIALQRSDCVLNLFHQTAFAATQPAHTPARMLAEINDADDTAFVIVFVFRRFAFDICGHAHAHLLKIWRDADFDIDVPASADE